MGHTMGDPAGNLPLWHLFQKKTSKKSQVTSLVLFFHHTSSNAALVFLEIGKMVPQNLKKWLRSMFIHSEVAAG
jgi:hypothetical protein